jgi:uncharacterized protein (DUF58 family)
MRPTGDAIAVGVLTALLLFIAVNLQAGWVYAVDALLIGLLVVGCASAALGIRGLTVERTMPPEAFEGDPVTVTLRVLVRRGRRFFIALHDAVPGLEPGTVRIPVCDARHPAAQSYQTAAVRRGVYMVEGIEARSSGLAGLFVFRRRLRSPGTMTVFPRYWALEEFPVPGRTGPDIASVPRPDRNGLEVAGVREFRDGDSLRHVHWRSTARRGTLVVREFEHETADAVTLLIDTRAEVYAADGSGQAFEDLMQAAASIVHTVTRSGRPVELIAARGTQVDTAVVGWSQALHWLARVQPHGMLSPQDVYRSAVVSETPVVICTADTDAPAALAQHGAPIAAVLVAVASYAEPPNRVDPDAGEMVLRALGVPVAVLRHGAEVGACLASLSP